ncbi:MAG: tetratricopeptide repeat protein [Candidatus Eisenbacteria bacterium]
MPPLPDAIDDGASGSAESDEADGATIALSEIPEPEPVELPTDLSTFGEETGTPFQLDRGAMEEALGGKSEPEHEPAERDETGGFEVEHFPVSGARADTEKDEASQAAGATFGEMDLDASVDDPEADADASSAEPIWQIDDPGNAASSNGVGTEEADPLAAAEEAYAHASWGRARAQYEAIHHEKPEDRHILSRLVEVLRHLHDHSGEVHYLGLLGDAWIAENEYEEALECFLRILQLDPKNGPAQRRLSKFRELGIKGAESIRESDSNALPGILEAGRTEVAVKSGDGFRTEDWVELEGLLEESSVRSENQMDESNCTKRI